MILLAGKSAGQMDPLLGLFGVTALVMLACYVSFLLAERISKIMGITGRAVITRMLGIILAALAVQFMIDGVLALANP
jgi:multiple antibiotic resistance protein